MRSAPPVLVEEAFAHVAVGVEVEDGARDGLAEQVGVADEVGETDNIAALQVDGERVRRIYAVCSASAESLDADMEGGQHAVVCGRAADGHVAVLTALVEGVDSLDMRRLAVVGVDVGFGEPAAGGHVDTGGGAVVEAELHQLAFSVGGEEALGGPFYFELLLQSECVTPGAHLFVVGEQVAPRGVDGGGGEFFLVVVAAGHEQGCEC